MLFSILFATAAAFTIQTIDATKCLHIPAVENFSFFEWAENPWLIRYLDDQDNILFALGRTFVKDTYSLLPGTNSEILLTSSSIRDHESLFQYVYGTQEDSEIGVFRIHYDGDKKHPLKEWNLIVFETDYTTYGVIVACIDMVEGTGRDIIKSAAIYTRDSNPLPDDVVRGVEENLLRKANMTIRFKTMYWGEC